MPRHRGFNPGSEGSLHRARLNQGVRVMRSAHGSLLGLTATLPSSQCDGSKKAAKFNAALEIIRMKWPAGSLQCNPQGSRYGPTGDNAPVGALMNRVGSHPCCWRLFYHVRLTSKA